MSSLSVKVVNFMECPFCHKNNAERVAPPVGSDGFVIGTYNKSTKQINPAGISVSLFTCHDCHHIWMMDD